MDVPCRREMLGKCRYPAVQRACGGEGVDSGRQTRGGQCPEHVGWVGWCVYMFGLICALKFQCEYIRDWETARVLSIALCTAA